MTEAQMIRRLLDQYERGMMLREEFWDQLMIIWTQSTPPATPPQRRPRW
jgi:hypothetical protein